MIYSTKWDCSVLAPMRDAKGWSHTKLAAEVGVTAETIKNWEDGVGEPRASHVLSLIRALDCESDELLRVLGRAVA